MPRLLPQLLKSDASAPLSMYTLINTLDCIISEDMPLNPNNIFVGIYLLLQI